MSTVLRSLGLDVESEGNLLRVWWDRLAPVPGGKLVFHRLIRVMIPYTGSLGAQIEELRPGYARVVLDDRRAVRNHLGSVHAVALANLAEFCGNLALAYGLSPRMRFIVTGMHMTYAKKARGRITATCECELPTGEEKVTRQIVVRMCDESGAEVARGELESLVSPKKAA
jgi:acyl-coenzyme A thioesterase PaaI-like protein